LIVERVSHLSASLAGPDHNFGLVSSLTVPGHCAEKQFPGNDGAVDGWGACTCARTAGRLRIVSGPEVLAPGGGVRLDRAK